MILAANLTTHHTDIIDRGIVVACSYRVYSKSTKNNDVDYSSFERGLEKPMRTYVTYS